MTEDGKLDLEDLKAMSCPTISNTMAAEVLKMDPARLAFYARTGQLGWKVLAPENGSRVIHNREDFIRYWTGEQKEPDPPDPEYPSTEQMLRQMWEAMMDIRILLKAIVNEKTAGVGTPTEERIVGYEQP